MNPSHHPSSFPPVPAVPSRLPRRCPLLAAVISGNADEQPRFQDHHVRALQKRRIDGLLVSPTDAGSPMRGEVAGSNVPLVVFVDRWIPDIDVPVVRTDGRAAVRHLVGHPHTLGHRRLAIIAAPMPTTATPQPTGALGHSAARALIDLIGNGTAASVTLTARLVVRRSCGEGEPDRERP